MTTAMNTPEQQQEFALREEIGLAGLVDQLGNFAHRAVHRQILQARVDDHAEDQAEDAKQNAQEQEFVAVDAQEMTCERSGSFRLASPASGSGFTRAKAENALSANTLAPARNRAIARLAVTITFAEQSFI